MISYNLTSQKNEHLFITIPTKYPSISIQIIMELFSTKIKFPATRALFVIPVSCLKKYTGGFHTNQIMNFFNVQIDTSFNEEFWQKCPPSSNESISVKVMNQLMNILTASLVCFYVLNMLVCSGKLNWLYFFLFFTYSTIRI